jgi:hypothetical protein
VDNAVNADFIYFWNLMTGNFLKQAGRLYCKIHMFTEILHSKIFLKFSLLPCKDDEIMRNFCFSRQERYYIIHVMRQMVLRAG